MHEGLGRRSVGIVANECDLLCFGGYSCPLQRRRHILPFPGVFLGDNIACAEGRARYLNSHAKKIAHRRALNRRRVTEREVCRWLSGRQRPRLPARSVIQIPRSASKHPLPMTASPEIGFREELFSEAGCIEATIKTRLHLIVH